MNLGGNYMPKKEGLTRDQVLRKALEKFDITAFKAWMKRFDKGLWNSFKNANNTIQMATMCKCIFNRSDMLNTEAHKKAREWLREHNMRGQIF